MSDRLQTSKVTLFKSFRQNGRRACHNLFAAACLLLGSTVAAQAADTASGNTLQSVDVAGLPGNKAQIILTLSNPAPAPLIILHGLHWTSLRPAMVWHNVHRTSASAWQKA